MSVAGGTAAATGATAKPSHPSRSSPASSTSVPSEASAQPAMTGQRRGSPKTSDASTAMTAGSMPMIMLPKLALVVATIGYHHICRRLLRTFEQGHNRRAERWYRVFNEVSVLLFAATVVLVVVKPF